MPYATLNVMLDPPPKALNYEGDSYRHPRRAIRALMRA